jgi:hypothetical protein
MNTSSTGPVRGGYPHSAVRPHRPASSKSGCGLAKPATQRDGTEAMFKPLKEIKDVGLSSLKAWI